MRQQYAADADADGEPGFSSARSALSESKGKAKPAAVEEPRVHPMFRKRGSDASASASGPSSRASSAPPRKRPKTVVKNEVIELLSSDDESPKARKGKSKAVEVIELLSSSPPDPVELKTSIEVAKREVIAIEDRDEDVADGDDDE